MYMYMYIRDMKGGKVTYLSFRKSLVLMWLFWRITLLFMIQCGVGLFHSERASFTYQRQKVYVSLPT